MNGRQWFASGALRRLFPQYNRRIELANAYQTVFDSPEGSRVLRDLLTAGGLLSTSVVEGDAQLTAYNEGKRALALHILHRLRWSEGELMQLGQELTAEEIEAREQAMSQETMT
jgi:hypothetical protein